MTVTPYNLNQYLVSSQTREEVEHIADVETMECSCEAALDYKTRSASDPCPHLEAALAFHSRANKTPARPLCGSLITLLIPA